MKIFDFQIPVLNKIETVVEKYLTDNALTVNVEYLDYEPSEGYVRSANVDALIAVYARVIPFDEANMSNTDDQQSENELIVDHYGFGDPIPDDANPLKYESTVRAAQYRGQIMSTLSYRAIMDRAEYENVFGLDPEKYKFTKKLPRNIQKFSPVGVMDSKRAFCTYRSTFVIGQNEFKVNEPLGLPYAGSNITQEPETPGETG